MAVGLRRWPWGVSEVVNGAKGGRGTVVVAWTHMNLLLACRAVQTAARMADETHGVAACWTWCMRLACSCKCRCGVHAHVRVFVRACGRGHIRHPHLPAGGGECLQVAAVIQVAGSQQRRPQASILDVHRRRRWTSQPDKQVHTSTSTSSGGA